MRREQAEDTGEEIKINKKVRPVSKRFEAGSNLGGGTDTITTTITKESGLIVTIYKELIPPKVNLIIEKAVRTNQQNILSYWRKVDIISPTIGPKDIEAIAVYCYGLTKIMEFYPVTTYSKVLLGKEYECITGINLIYNFVLQQLEILKKLPEFASSVRVLHYLEILIQSVIIYMFKEIEPKKILAADPRLLNRIVESIDSQTEGTRFKSLIQLKKLLGDTSLHHSIFVALANAAKNKQTNKLKYILQHYKKERESSITNTVISSIIQRIFFSKSASAKLDSWIKDIKASKFKINVSKEEEESRKKNKNANYWKEKYFNVLNEKEDINTRGLEEAEYINKINELQYRNNVLGKISDDALSELARSLDVIGDLKRAFSPLRSYTQDPDSIKDEEYFTEMYSKILAFSKFSTQLIDSSLTDINERAKNIKKFAEETDTNWAAERQNKEQEARKESEQKISDLEELPTRSPTNPEVDNVLKEFEEGAIVDSEAPPPPPMIEPPPLIVKIDPKEKARLERIALKEQYSKIFDPEILESLFPSEDEIDKKVAKTEVLPFLNFIPTVNHDATQTSIFTNSSNVVLSKNDISEFLTIFAKDPSKSSASENKISTKTNILPEKLAQLAAFVMKRIRKTADDIIGIISEANISTFDEESIRVLINLTPTVEIVKSLLNADEKGILVEETDIFVYKIWVLPQTRSILKFMLFYFTCNDSLIDLTAKVDAVSNACEILLNSDLIKNIFNILLKIGNLTSLKRGKPPIQNYLIESFDSISSIKSADGQSTILAYLVSRCKNINPDFSELFKLNDLLKIAVNIPISVLKGDLDNIWSNIDNTETLIKSSPKFVDYKAFHKDALARIEPCTNGYSKISELSVRLSHYFCLGPKPDLEALFKEVLQLTSSIKSIISAPVAK